MRNRVCWVLLSLVLLAVPAAAADMRNLSMPLATGGSLLYGLSAPAGPAPAQGFPLVLALHPGGERVRYYGSAYAQAIVLPALAPLDAVVVAPDCPTRSWTDPESDAAVMSLLERVMREHTVDRRRIVVVGYSIGGRGTWFMASRHRDFFTAAIPMAASTGNDPVDTLATMPTYIVHSRRDQVIPFAPAEKNARALEQLGRRVRFEALDQPTHYEMLAYIPSLRRGFAWVAGQWNGSGR